MARNKHRHKLAEMAATPLEISVGGTVYRLAPLTLGQYADMERWAQQQPFADLGHKLSAIKDKRLREEAKSALLARAIEQSESEEYIAARLNSAEAVERVFTLMLRTNHPDVTDAQIREILNVQGLLQIRAWVEQLIGLDETARKN